MTSILIIDDDVSALRLVGLTLERRGYEIQAATSGEEGLEKVELYKPDLIILDVMMDSTTEGFQVTLKLKSQDPTSEYYAFREIPILILTAIHSTTPMRFGPTEDYLPVEEFIDKPIDPDELVQKVASLLEAK